LYIYKTYLYLSMISFIIELVL